MWCTLAAVLLTVPILSTGFQLNSHVGYFEPVNIKATFIASSHTKMAAKFNFNAHGRSFKLQLRTHPTLFHPNFYLITMEKNGVRKKTTPNMKHHVLGHLEGERDSLVYGRIANDSFDGVIRLKSESYFVESLHGHPSASTHPGFKADHNRVIYKLSDVNYTTPTGRGCKAGVSARMRGVQLSAQFNDVPDHSTLVHDLLRRKRQSVNERTCTVRVVADFVFYDKVGGQSESNTMDEMTQHIMNADSIYRSTTFEGNNGNIQGSRFYIHSSVIYKTEDSSNPLVGDFDTNELLEAFSQEDFDDVCLGHLFTYRDFQGTIGLAYLGDPNGQLAGGICQKRTRTSIGEANLNTGFTSLLNYGQKLSRAVSYITTAHELGHNHGAEHDSGECVDQQYIMYPYATSGATKEFSSCSKRSIGRTIEARGSCFTEYPSSSLCGNGVIEEGEDCDCGTTTETAICDMNDPCCTLNCTLKESANCSSQASACCKNCLPSNNVSQICLRGDSELEDGGCQNNTFCVMNNPNCPLPIPEEDGTVCNNGSNVCDSGACTGSPCSLFSEGSSSCYCGSTEQLCHVCCEVDGVCKSSFEILDGKGFYVAAGFPCKNFTGYCTEEHECKGVNNDDILNNLRDILLDFTSILNWVKGNWYWVLIGFAVVAILIVLLQVTYRRKKLPNEGGSEEQNNSRWKFGRRRRRQIVGTREEVLQESTGLLRQTRT